MPKEQEESISSFNGRRRTGAPLTPTLCVYPISAIERQRLVIEGAEKLGIRTLIAARTIAPSNAS